MLKYEDQIGNTIVINYTNSKKSQYKTALRQKWNGRFKGLKDENKQDRDDNYVVVSTGAWYSKRDDTMKSDRYIVVAGNRYYLNYENSVTGLDGTATLYLVDIDALEKSKAYPFNPKYDDDREDEDKSTKFDSFEDLRKLAKQQYIKAGNSIPTLRVYYTKCDAIINKCIWYYQVTSNVTDKISKYIIVKTW